MGVFKSYDVRGIYPDQIDEDFAYRMGRAFVRFLKARKVVAGHDARKMSEKMYESLVQGLVDEGAEVTAAGLITTPMLYYLSAKHGFDGAITVTASHNPPEYTGFKMCGRKAAFISLEKGLRKIKEMMETGDFSEKLEGSTIRLDYTEEYCDFIAGFAKGNITGVKLVVDTSNGAAGPFYEKILERLGVDAEKLFFEPDGTFPNHSPNPLMPESQEALKSELSTGNYDMGALIDADGDRILFFDEKGNQLKSSTIPILLCRHYYEGVSGKYIVLDVLNYRNSVRRALEDEGMNVEVTPVGYTNIRDGLDRTKGLFGAEYSGHFSQPEVGNCDSSPLALVKMMSVLALTGKKLSELVEDLEEKVVIQENYEVEDKDRKIEKIDEEFSDADETLRLDGVSKSFSGFWLNVRKSNTEPLVRVTVEAGDQEKADEVLQRVKGVLGIK